MSYDIINSPKKKQTVIFKIYTKIQKCNNNQQITVEFCGGKCLYKALLLDLFYYFRDSKGDNYVSVHLVLHFKSGFP